MIATVKTPAIRRVRTTVAVFGTAAMTIEGDGCGGRDERQVPLRPLEVERERQRDHGRDRERAGDETPERRDEVTGGERGEHGHRGEHSRRSRASARSSSAHR